MAKDPYQYFRIEARQLLEQLSQGFLDLERADNQAELVNRLLRVAHTLKGAARIVKQLPISEKAHSIEEILVPHREGEARLSAEKIKSLLGLADEIGSDIKKLESGPMSIEKENKPVQINFYESTLIPIAEMDEVLASVSEALVSVGTLYGETETLKTTLTAVNLLPRHQSEKLRVSLERIHRTVPMAIERLERDLLKVRGKAIELRMLPASSCFAALQRSIRDDADSLKKQIEFKTSGGDTRLDAHILNAIKGALIQIVRNSVAHGIEEKGTIQIRVERRGNQVAFVCRDDGRGINIEAVRQTAINRGVISASEAAHLTMEGAIRLLLQGGLSTSQSVNEVSGRGVGLGLIRETVLGLKGSLDIKSDTSHGTIPGTTIDICVPVSIESVTVLTVCASDMKVSIPLDCIRHTQRLSSKEVAHSSEGQTVVYGHGTIPFAPLTKILKRPLSKKVKGLFWSIMVVQAGENLVAIGVDSFVGVENVIMKPLPEMMEASSLASGTSLDKFGDPQLVLDPEGLVNIITKAKIGLDPISTTRRPSVLVIDDSLTTRMLEQSILESAGYAVTLATSGEQGFEKAISGQYELILVDVEMPGMDGFEFIERAMAHPALREIPAVLVTSRASPEDRKRGERAGARAHIMKSEFNEGQFLGVIRNLIGEI